MNQFLKRHSSTFLTVLGAIGVSITAVMAVKSAPKAKKLLDKAEEEKGEPLTTFEQFKAVTPAYLPAALTGTATVMCIFGANMLNQKKQASLASAYALLSQTYQQYRKTANVLFGEDADSRIQAEIAQDRYIHADGSLIYDAATDDSSPIVLFYDLFSKRYFRSTLPAVLQAQYHLNRNMILRGAASVNEYYDFLGLDKMAEVDGFGWGSVFWDNGFQWIDFENRYTKLDDGMECYIISMAYTPECFY
jgi:hypothetical protein